MKKMLYCFLFTCIIGSTQAQSTINSTGNSTLFNGNTYSYSIGEMVLVHTASTSNIVVTQGVLQGSGTIVGIETMKLTENELMVYPNPARDVLNLKINLQEKGNLKVELYDLSGRLVLFKDWNLNKVNDLMQLNIQSYAAGNYVLNVQYKVGDKISYQSYKIQKLN